MNNTTRKCQTEGCCIATNENGLISSTKTRGGSTNPDVNYPSFTYDLLNIILCLPMAVWLFCIDLYRCIVMKQPKLPTWDLHTSLTMASVHATKYALRHASLSTWRKAMALPTILKDESQKYDSPFVVHTLNLPGVLSNCDSVEDGTRIIQAQWHLPPPPPAPLTTATAASLSDDKKRECSEKVILYLHGGGYCLKDWKVYYKMTERLVKCLDRGVFSVNYRLAPETQFPGALYDAAHAYLHLIRYYKIKPQNISIVGDSAGGGLALSLLLYLRDHHYPLPGPCVLVSPWLDLSYCHRSWKDSGDFDTLYGRPEKEDIMNPTRFYLGIEAYSIMSQHPYVSPLFANDYSHLPPLLVISGGSEVMRDEIRLLADRLELCQDARFVHREFEDMIHDFPAFNFKQSYLAWQNIQEWLVQDTRKFE